MVNETASPRTRRPALDLSSGRANQKARTYQALLEAAMSFVREGRDFSVADVADAARVGRSTAYSYFPTKEALLAQAVSEVVVRADFADLSALFQQSSDVTARVKAVVEASDASIQAHEAQYRTLLRISLESDSGDDLPHRAVYRPKRLAEALRPAHEQLDPHSLERLVAALCLCAGIEAQMTLRDVCGLTPEEASEVKLWAADALLQVALSEVEPA